MVITSISIKTTQSRKAIQVGSWFDVVCFLLTSSESPERLVHGPMTALMLLENVVYHHPELKLASFDYQARNPQLVNQEQTFYGKWLESGTSIFVWCVDEKDVVGMTGKVAVQPSVAS